MRKILGSDETDFRYERERQPMPRVGPWQGHLETPLASNEGEPSRDRPTPIRVFEELEGLGCEGGQDAVRRFARTWSKSRGARTAEAYVPLYYAPGEACRFDWSHEVVPINGTTVTVKAVRVRLYPSPMMFARATMRESQEPRHRARTDGAPMADVRLARPGIRLRPGHLHAGPPRPRGRAATGPRPCRAKTAVEASFTGKERRRKRVRPGRPDQRRDRARSCRCAATTWSSR